MAASPFAFLRGSAAVMAADLATTPAERHRRAVLRRLPPVELRRLRDPGAAADLRHQRLRRDAAGTVRVGRQAPGRQLRRRRPRASARPAATRAAARCARARATARRCSATPRAAARRLVPEHPRRGGPRRAAAARRAQGAPRHGQGAAQDARPHEPRRAAALRAAHRRRLAHPARAAAGRRLRPHATTSTRRCGASSRTTPTRWRPSGRRCSPGIAWRTSRARSSGSARSAPRRSCSCSSAPQGDDPLFLQLKQAAAVGARAVRRHRPASDHEAGGSSRGQRLMQAASDVFLGWARGGPDGGQDFYVRQLRDMKGSAEIERMSPRELDVYAALCGATLARAHARSGQAPAIAGYLGRGDAFDRAVAAFAVRLRRPDRARPPRPHRRDRRGAPRRAGGLTAFGRSAPRCRASPTASPQRASGRSCATHWTASYRSSPHRHRARARVAAVRRRHPARAPRHVTAAGRRDVRRAPRVRDCSSRARGARPPSSCSRHPTRCAPA